MNESKRNLITFTSRWDSFAFTAVDKWQCWLFRGLIKYQHSLTITKQDDMGKGYQYFKQLFLVFWKRCGVKKNRCKICTFQLKTDSRWKIRNKVTAVSQLATKKLKFEPYGSHENKRNLITFKEYWKVYIVQI